MNGNFKVRALESDGNYFNKGDIIEFKDGQAMWIDGRVSLKYKNFEDFITQNYEWEEYIKLIEGMGENKMESGKVNFKVKCLDVRGYNKYYTKGKVYEVIDGVFTYDDGDVIKNITSFDDFNTSTFAMWELIEDSSDLRELIKPCYLVKIRDGRTLIALECEDIRIEFYDINNINSAIIDIDSFDYNLDSDSCRNYDIIEVYGLSSSLFQKSTELRDLIWKRTEISPTQLKLEELEKRQREIADEMEKLRKEL